MIAVPPLLTLLTLTLTLFIHSFIECAQCGQIEGEVRIIAESRLADGAGHGARYDPSTAACRYDERVGRFDVAAKVFFAASSSELFDVIFEPSRVNHSDEVKSSGRSPRRAPTSRASNSHTVGQTRQDRRVCVVSGGVN